MYEKNDQRILAANREARESIAYEIYNSFRKENEKIYAEEYQHALYDVVKFLCNREEIEIVPFSTVLSSAGEGFRVQDIASLSHFPVRTIALEENWDKKEGGSFVGWMVEGNRRIPIACIQRPQGGYDYFAPELSRFLSPVTAEIKEKLLPEGVMLYRVFPQKQLSERDFLHFSLKILHRRDLILFLALMAAVSLVGILTPLLTRMIYDFLIPGEYRWQLLAVTALLVLCNFASISMDVVKNLAWFRITSRVRYEFQEALFHRVINMPAGVLRSFSGADLAKRVLDAESLLMSLFDVLLSAGFVVLFSLIYLIPMAQISPSAALWTVGLTAGLTAVQIPIVLKKRTLAEQKNKADTDLATWSWQAVEGIEKIKEAGAEDRASGEYVKGYLCSNRLDIRILRMTQNINVITMVYQMLFTLVFYQMAVKGRLSAGSALSFLAAFQVFSHSVILLCQAVADSSGIRPIYAGLKTIFETPSDFSKQGEFVENLEGRVDVDHVTFSYQHDGNDVLKDLSVHIEPGEYVGIVGFSGCGKSTLVRMLLGLETPTGGAIYYDGQNLEKLDQQHLFGKMGIVLQNEKVFSGTIRENITVTRPGATKEELLAVIRAVGLESDIRRMPMGAETYISEGGSVISGGQQQRILLARALIGHPSIVLLDEATSALDNKTQQMVCETLKEIQATKIVVAHRLSTLTACSRILVMDEGRFVEDGTYEELMNKKGRFYELVQRQVV